jgi:AcrR family transcriptional regulator
MHSATPVLHPLALPRRPRQQRAIDRCEAVLDEAAALLAKRGLSGFSIPAVAERLGYTRASIYKFFPTPYAVLNELIRRHFVGLEEKLAAAAADLASVAWQDVVRIIVREAAAYHNAHPVGMMLSLGGAVTDESYRSYALTVEHLGTLASSLLRARGLDVATARLDIGALAVDLGTTCFRHGYLKHGRITPEYREAAAAVMIQFISGHLSGAAAT